MRILIATDAWAPQVSGVVRTLTRTVAELERLTHRVEVLAADRFPASFPLPTYPEIRLAVAVRRRVDRLIDRFGPDAIHVATEGPIGLAVRRWCIARGVPFTTAYHTDFPQYVRERTGLPLAVTYACLRWFHGPSAGVMVATERLERMLGTAGFQRLRRWSRGVDTALFRPGRKDHLPFPRPILLHVGRLAAEKNIAAFLSLDLPGTKVVVGRGPAEAELRARFPEARFLGLQEGEALARIYAAADAFVFPSRTDTFGLVLLEALASGVPVAAYPVRGPLDVIGSAPVGALREDLGAAVREALALEPAACRAHALGFSWEASARQFLGNLVPLRHRESLAA